MNTNASTPVKYVAKFQSVATAIAVILSMCVLVAAGAGVATAKGLPKAKGIVNCAIFSGTGTLDPGLTPTGAAGGVKINFTASVGTPAAACPNADITKPKGVTLLGGTVTGSGYYKALPAPASASSCADFDGTDVVGEITVTICMADQPPRCDCEYDHHLQEQSGHCQRSTHRHDHSLGSSGYGYQDWFVRRPEFGQYGRAQDGSSGSSVRSGPVLVLQHCWR